jgi:hypothetical protein
MFREYSENLSSNKIVFNTISTLSAVWQKISYPSLSQFSCGIKRIDFSLRLYIINKRDKKKSLTVV